MSGRAPSCCQAKRLPVRQKPVWISSQMNRTLVLGADIADGLEVALGRYVDAGLPLDGLDDDGDRPGRDGLLDERRRRRRGHASRSRARRGRSSPRHRDRSDIEMMAIVRPWKLPVGADDLLLPVLDALDLGAPAARRLERGLHRLGSRVHGQRHGDSR